MQPHEYYMQRCFELARLGAGSVSPNPMVGAVLVYQDRIIGEGWHQRYGQAHAEVNAVNNVKTEDRAFISQSTLYVSLEPCNIYGKTPPCTNLILQNKIPRVIISCLDQTPEVAGKGVEILRANGVEVITGILEDKGKEISRFRNHFVTHERPYIILKFAQTRNGLFGKANEQVWISNEYSKRLVHKWRSEVDAILVGTNTAQVDNPALTNRLYFGKSPLRIVIDKHLKLPDNLHLFEPEHPTLVITSEVNPPPATSAVTYVSVPDDANFLSAFLKILHSRKIAILLVEGGAKLLEQLLQNNLWDEARVLIGDEILTEGIAAPLIFGELTARHQLDSDQIICYRNVHRR
ncbi:MAG: bifunctional diaminohydroxyphosphoribosylaminopyrimidine deaminase/5-amino-6-(5-phosphoribosylamino)uracil reductase RibD [Saprospiraceae bacterium]